MKYFIAGATARS